jgi:putative phosphoribosyl transferase
MYFKDRAAAGRLLATQVARKYGDQQCAVVALGDGGVMVGMPIAMKLRTVIMLLITENVELPREATPIGGIALDGSFTYNHKYSDSELEEMSSEYHGFIEQEKMFRVNEMHRLMSQGVLIRRDLLEDRIVILVSDGLQDGFSLDMAVRFLKPIRTKGIIIATPLASVPAVDHMHIETDDIFCLNVVKDYFDTNHYYDMHDVPAHETIVKTIDHVVQGWK